MSGSRFVFHDVDRNRWDDLVLLFDGRGGPKYCWCMAWRQKPAKTKYSDSKERNAALKAALHERTTRDIPIGIIGYDGDAPVAWCSIAPRPTYRRLGGPDDCADDPNSVWSLACFFVKRDFRGQGMTGQLLQAAIARARRGGATIVEAYPVDPTSPSYRFMGFVSVFERAGFVHVADAGTRRHVMRLALV